jgi:hypothetical protein
MGEHSRQVLVDPPLIRPPFAGKDQGSVC